MKAANVCTATLVPSAGCVLAGGEDWRPRGAVGACRSPANGAAVGSLSPRREVCRLLCRHEQRQSGCTDNALASAWCATSVRCVLGVLGPLGDTSMLLRRRQAGAAAQNCHRHSGHGADVAATERSDSVYGLYDTCTSAVQVGCVTFRCRTRWPSDTCAVACAVLRALVCRNRAGV